MIKYRSIRDNNVSIFKNVLINNDSVTAYYILYPYNYDIMDSESSGRHINRLYSAFSNLHSSIGEIKMSMFKLKNIISKEDTIVNIVNTIREYDKEYKEFPEENKKYINNIAREFSILAINIDIKNSFDIENESLMSITKNIIDNFVKSNFSMNAASIDEEAVMSQNVRIERLMRRYAIPANTKLIMNIYVNSLFPSYNLIYNNYLVNNAEAILGNVKQEIIPHLGWFEMSNSGIVAFGGTQRTTYGSVLTILEFPERINSESFNIAVSGLKVNMHLLSREKAILQFKRLRADIKEEAEGVDITGTTDSDISEEYSLNEKSLKNTRKGRIATEVDANILVIADTKEALDAKKKNIISILSEINVVCSIADKQARTFIDSFVKGKPKKYEHIMDLQYALSFQLDDGILVGDQDSKFAAPVIGIS